MSFQDFLRVKSRLFTACLFSQIVVCEKRATSELELSVFAYHGNVGSGEGH